MAFWDGLLFGMLLQLSVGPVCIAVLQRAITQGFRNALRMIAGVAFVDAAYMAAAVGGLSLLLQIPWVKGIVLIGGAATLVWFGIGSIRAKSEHGGQEEQSERAEKELKQAGFLHGILLTLTNPLTILFWSGVFGSLMASRTLSDSSSLFVFAAGCMLATLLFLSLIAVLGTYISKALQPSWIKRMNVVVGIFLIGFAIVLLLKGWTV